MIRKYTDEEYDNARNGDKLKLECEYCHKEFLKDSKKVKLYVRGNANPVGIDKCQFCSIKCSGLAKVVKRIELECQTCGTKVVRRPSEIKDSGNIFCNSSCAAKYSNANRDPSLFLGRQIASIKETCRKKFHQVEDSCKWCGNLFLRSGTKKRNITCSKKCATLLKTGGKAIFELEDAKKVLNNFVEEHNRIPGQREVSNLLDFARLHFKTWNKMVVALGYTPMTKNLRRKRIKCSDGHIVDSVSEKIIDEFLTSHNISHEVHKRYNDSKLISDFFLTDHNVYVEYFGLDGGFIKYDENTQRKLKLFEDNNLKVITVYPKDLFPENRLNEVFKLWILS